MSKHGVRSVALGAGRTSATGHAVGSYDATGNAATNGSATAPIGSGPIGVAANASVNGKVAGTGTAGSFTSNHAMAALGYSHGTTTLGGTSVSRGHLSASGSGQSAFNGNGMANASLANNGSPVASFGVNSAATGQLPGTNGAPFNAMGTGGANASGNSQSGTVTTQARVGQSAFGEPSSSNPAMTTAGARSMGGAEAAISP